jgi:copper homeostasis protein
MSMYTDKDDLASTGTPLQALEMSVSPRYPLLEVCCASADFALQAQAAGADRVELCADLVQGGTTPSAGAIEVAVERLEIPVMVMIRPRGGDFLYSPSEVDVMLRDIEVAARLGARGVVFGALTPDGAVDAAVTRELVRAAGSLEVTFHRAFDLSRDLHHSLDALLEAGVHRVLTSAGRATVVEGLHVLSELVARAGDRLTVMPGGGIRPDNVEAVMAVAGVREIHVGASGWRESRMGHRVPGVPMGREYRPDEYLVEVADVTRVAAVARRVHGGP